MIDERLIEDNKIFTMTQQLIINPELDNRICMFSLLYPVKYDIMIIRSNPLANTETYFRAGTLKLPIAVFIMTQLTTITAAHFSTIILLQSYSKTIRFAVLIRNSPTRDITTYLKYEG